MYGNEELFFFDNGSRFPHLRKSDRIPCEKLPIALQEFRLSSELHSSDKGDTSQLLHNKLNEKKKQNVNFEGDDGKKLHKRRKKTRGNDGFLDLLPDFDIEDDGKFLFEEAKYSATSILGQLGRLLQHVWERNIYQNNWHQARGKEKHTIFERDIKGFKWRFEITQENNRKSFFLPDYIIKLIDVEYQDFTRMVQYRAREWQTQAYKDVTNFSTGALKRTDSGIFSVPLTRMSELTCNTLDGDNTSLKCKVLQGKSSKDSGMTIESDGPAIIAYRRESKGPLHHLLKPQLKHQGKISSVERGPPQMFDAANRLSNLRNLKAEEEEEGGTHTTKFSLSSKDCHERGWITDPSSFSDHEKKAMSAYIRKLLLEAVHRREEEEVINSKLLIHPEVVVHYYGDAKKKASCMYQNGGKSKRRKNQRNNIGIPFMITLRDGSFTIYYPSGNVAVVNSFVAGQSRSSYILVYSDAPDNSVILAHFTPSGNGVCYHKNGQISFVSTSRHACCHDEVGALLNKWKWTGRKLVPSFTLQLSSNLTFRCSNKDSMALFVNIDGESTKIKLVEGEEPSNPIQSSYGQRNSSKRSKSREGRLRSQTKVKENESKLSIIRSSSALNSYQIELNALHDKFRETFRNWMDHYRIAVGIKAPNKRLSVCTKQKAVRSADLPKHSKSSALHRRMASAPANFRYSLQERLSPTNQYCSEILFRDDSAIGLMKLPFRCGVLQSPGAALPKKGCPVVYRMEMIGIRDTHCRCDRKKIPIVTDIEFDRLISSLPKTQLVVVSVFEERCSNAFDSTLNEIHYQLNKDRSFPCVQSSSDPYRLFRYPIPMIVTKEDNALLIDRHKVAAGMFLMYIAGRLLFSDYIFDGYGYTKKDFLNQMTRTRKEALEEKYLPGDFHFTPRSRSPSPHRATPDNSKSTVFSEDIYRYSSTSSENVSRLSSKTSVRFVDNNSSKAEIKSI